MGSMSLSDIILTPLETIPTIGGNVMHAMKSSDHGYTSFGEAYFSWVEKGTIKGWKRHLRMQMNLIVPLGSVKFVFFLNGGRVFREEKVGIERYMRLSVPPGIWFGFQGLAAPQSLVLNIASLAHDPKEVDRIELGDIEYEWS